MKASRVPDALTVASAGDDQREYECFEGSGGYFDGTLFEAPADMTTLCLYVARRLEDGSKDLEDCDRYFYTLDRYANKAVYLSGDTVARVASTDLN